MDKNSNSYLFFDGSLAQGGAERVISLLSKVLLERGNQVKILLYYDREIFYKIDERIEIIIVSQKTGSTNIFKNILWLRRFFKSDPSRIISFLAPFNMLAIFTTLFLKKTIIVADRSDPWHDPETWLMRKIRNVLYMFADGVVLQTNHSFQYFNRFIQKKCCIISNPCFLGDNVGIALKIEKHNEIVTVGRLMKVKNQEMLIKAFARIHHLFPDYYLTIFGEGPNRNELESLIDEFSLGNYVFLPGTVSNIFERIASSKLFVFTSNYEGMPNAVIEAMCLGLPVISTKVAGATDLINHDENGILIDIGAEDALVDAMTAMLKDDEKRNRIAINAIAVADYLELSKITNQWVNFINSRCNG